MVVQEKVSAPIEASNPRPAVASEEMLVADIRAGVSPAQMVERKLLTLMGGASLPVSQLLRRVSRFPSA